MEEKENQSGCRGCIDHNGYSNCCDFIENHRRCRPVPAGPKGCVLKAATWEKQAKLEKEHAWDQKKARRLLEKGESVRDVAKAVGASICSIGAMLNGKAPPRRPEVPTGKAPVTWGEAEIPLRPEEIKKKGRKAMEKGTWEWARKAEFLPLYEAKLTDAEIGEKMGLAAKTIGIYRQKMGYPCITGEIRGKKMKNARAVPDAAEDGSPEGDRRREEKRREEKRREEKPPAGEEDAPMKQDEQGLSLGALADVLSKAASGFDCPRELLGPNGEPVQGCEVNIKYGVDGKPERVLVLLT